MRYLSCLSHLPSSDHPVSGAKYKSWSSSLCIFLHSRVPTPVMGENGQKSVFLTWHNLLSGPPNYRGSAFTLRHTTLRRTHLDRWSARHRDLNLTTHHTHKGQTSMPPVGFETTIPASERQQAHTLDRAVIGQKYILSHYFRGSINRTPLSKRSRDAVGLS